MTREEQDRKETEDNYREMVEELLEIEEKTGYFYLTNRERREFQSFVLERVGA